MEGDPANLGKNIQRDPLLGVVETPILYAEIKKLDKWFSLEEAPECSTTKFKHRPKIWYWQHRRAQEAVDSYWRFFAIARGDCLGNPDMNLGHFHLQLIPEMSLGPDKAVVMTLYTPISKGNLEMAPEFMGTLRGKVPDHCAQNKMANLMIIRYGRESVLALPEWNNAEEDWTGTHRLILNLNPNDFGTWSEATKDTHEKEERKKRKQGNADNEAISPKRPKTVNSSETTKNKGRLKDFPLQKNQNKAVQKALRVCEIWAEQDKWKSHLRGMSQTWAFSHGCSKEDYKTLGRWFEDKEKGVFESWYLHNLIPSALAALAGYDSKTTKSFVVARSRAWWSERIGNESEFTVAGMVLSDNLKSLVDFIFPDIIEKAKECWKSWNSRSSFSVGVASKTNTLVTEALVYCAVIWLQDHGKRLKEIPSLINEAPYSWFLGAPEHIKKLLAELDDEVLKLETEALIEYNKTCQSMSELQASLLDSFLKVIPND